VGVERGGHPRDGGLGCVYLLVRVWTGKITHMKLLLVVGCLLLASPVFGQDAIDLSACQYHNSPSVAAWPVTSDFISLEFAREEIRFKHSKSGQWPVVPFETTTQEGTIWLGVNINGRWHCAGAERIRTGQTAKQLTTPYDMVVGWLYDANRWQEMTAHRLQPGEVVAMWITSGDMRSQMNPGPRERTQVRLVRLPVSGNGSYPPWETYSPQPIQPPTPNNPQPIPVQTGISNEQWAWLVTTLTQLHETQKIQRESISDLYQWAQQWRAASDAQHQAQMQAFEAQLAGLKARGGNDWKDYVLMGLMGAIGIRQEAK